MWYTIRWQICGTYEEYEWNDTKTWDVKKKSKKGKWSNEMLSEFKNQYQIYNSINLFCLDLKCSNMHQTINHLEPKVANYV